MPNAVHGIWACDRPPTGPPTRGGSSCPRRPPRRSGRRPAAPAAAAVTANRYAAPRPGLPRAAGAIGRSGAPDGAPNRAEATRTPLPAAPYAYTRTPVVRAMLSTYISFVSGML